MGQFVEREGVCDEWSADPHMWLEQIEPARGRDDDERGEEGCGDQLSGAPDPRYVRASSRLPSERALPLRATVPSCDRRERGRTCSAAAGPAVVERKTRSVCSW